MRLCILAIFLGLFLSTPVHATPENRDTSKRVALVIGNSSYANSPLKNPVNDAKDMATKLRKLGFEVIERNNLTTKQIGGTLREFRSKLAPGAVALVFYAGHGLNIKGDNYLPAVDADINSEEDVQNQSLSVKQIMDVLDESKSRLNLVFLDACRNNPYARSFRSSDRGLARVNAPSGTLISYATKPGSVAADGTGRNGLYTSKLLAQLDSNLQIELALKHVVTEVKSASKGKQEPWMEGSIEGDFCFGGCAGNSTPPQSMKVESVAAPVSNKEDGETSLWAEVQKGNSKEDYEAYLTQYPKGKYAVLAKSRIRKLQNHEAIMASIQPSDSKPTVNIKSEVSEIDVRNEMNELLVKSKKGDLSKLERLKELAGRGNIDGQNYLGDIYLQGQGVAQDASEAIIWYRKAAEQGNASAQNNLGFIYTSGMGVVTKNHSEAVKWLTKSAEQGNAFGQVMLGYMYDNGFGVAQDESMAVKWYRKAAEQGDGNAIRNLKLIADKYR
jgi:hypothetical protein